MASETVEVLVEGGKATAAPPLGPALGPLGVNIGQVIAEINKKTGDFRGMNVPVKVTVDKETKVFTISIGTPPTADLIKKEAGVEKGAANPKTETVGNLSLEQVKKIAEMKTDNMNSFSIEKSMREVIGACDSMGVYIEGKRAKEIQKEIDAGLHSQWFKTKTQKHSKKR